MSEYCLADISPEDAKAMILCLGAITPSMEDFAGSKRYFVKYRGRIYAAGDTPEEALSYAHAYLSKAALTTTHRINKE